MKTVHYHSLTKEGAFKLGLLLLELARGEEGVNDVWFKGIDSIGNEYVIVIKVRQTKEQESC